LPHYMFALSLNQSTDYQKFANSKFSTTTFFSFDFQLLHYTHTHTHSFSWHIDTYVANWGEFAGILVLQWGGLFASGMDELENRWIDGWMDEWMGGRMVRWSDGESKNKKFLEILCVFFVILCDN